MTMNNKYPEVAVKDVCIECLITALTCVAVSVEDDYRMIGLQLKAHGSDVEFYKMFMTDIDYLCRKLAKFVPEKISESDYKHLVEKRNNAIIFLKYKGYSFIERPLEDDDSITTLTWILWTRSAYSKIMDLRLAWADYLSNSDDEQKRKIVNTYGKVVIDVYNISSAIYDPSEANTIKKKFNNAYVEYFKFLKEYDIEKYLDIDILNEIQDIHDNKL